MVKQSKSIQPLEKFQLPVKVKARDGHIFNPNDQKWRLRNGVFSASLNFDSLPITDALQFSLKSVLIWYAENYSIGYVSAEFNRFKKLIRFIVCDDSGLADEINALHLMNFRSDNNARNESDLGGLGALLKK